MARESTITLEQVAAAAAELIASGAKPTLRAVRESLGTGSMGTIARMLQAWKGSQERTAVAELALPPALQRAILDFMQSELAAARAPLVAELADTQATAADLAAENERQTDDLAECGRQIEAHAAAQATAEGKAQQLAEQLAVAQAQAQAAADQAARQLAQERASAEAARTELAKAQLRLEDVPRTKAELADVRDELAAERAGREAGEKRAVVAEAQRDALAAQLAEAKAAAQTLAAQLEKAQARAEQLSADLADARVSAQAAQAEAKRTGEHLAIAQAEAKRIGEQLATAQAEAAKASGIAQQLQTELDAVRKAQAQPAMA